MFGIEWEYIPAAGGSMVRPGKPFLEDANEWKEKVVGPMLTPGMGSSAKATWHIPQGR
jgi:hypothetical protein